MGSLSRALVTMVASGREINGIIVYSVLKNRGNNTTVPVPMAVKSRWRDFCWGKGGDIGHGVGNDGGAVGENGEHHYL